MKKLLLLVSFFLSLSSVTDVQAVALEDKFHAIVADKKATVGIALLIGDNVFLINEREQYPLMSVFKLPIALAVLDKMERHQKSLDTPIRLELSEVRQNTWSPLAKENRQYPISTTLGELISYTVAKSDNNTCDKLIEIVGGLGSVNDYVHRLGLNSFELTSTEAQMQEDLHRIYENWSTPLEMAKLMSFLFSEPLSSEKYQNFLIAQMKESAKRSKIAEGLPPGVVLGNRSGLSYRKKDGTRICENDMAALELPNGKRAFLAVFIKDSLESDETNREIIAKIAKATYEHFMPQGREELHP